MGLKVGFRLFDEPRLSLEDKIEGVDCPTPPAVDDLAISFEVRWPVTTLDVLGESKGLAAADLYIDHIRVDVCVCVGAGAVAAGVATWGVDELGRDLILMAKCSATDVDDLFEVIDETVSRGVDPGELSSERLLYVFCSIVDILSKFNGIKSLLKLIIIYNISLESQNEMFSLCDLFEAAVKIDLHVKQWASSGSHQSQLYILLSTVKAARVLTLS
jgi:hypothetical protein